METSAENARSSASSSASTTTSHASASSLECHQPSYTNQEDREKDIAPSSQGFNIHMDEELHAQYQPKTGSAASGFHIHIDNNESSAAAPKVPTSFCAKDNRCLHKDDLPDLEMSFIPDRTIQDAEQVEQDITTFGMGEEPLDYSDPFNAGLQNLLLAGLSKPLAMYKGIYQHEQMMPAIKTDLAVSFGTFYSHYFDKDTESKSGSWIVHWWKADTLTISKVCNTHNFLF